VVLPMEPRLNNHRILNESALRGQGSSHMADWLAKAQSFWEERRTDKSKKRFPSVLDRLNYNALLSNQNPMKKFLVLYNTAGTNVSSCVIDRKELPDFFVNRINIKPTGFVAETMTMFYETDDELEAHYLCAVLNSEKINEAIKPLQTRGLFGERHIMRRPFMLPISQFNKRNPIHAKLAQLSKQCHLRIASIQFTKKSAAGKRQETRRVVMKELREIDELISMADFL